MFNWKNSETDKVKSKVTDEKPCRVTLSVQVPAEAVRAAREKVALEFQKHAQVAGFRAGKVPLDVVKRTFADRILAQTLEEALRDSVPQVLKEKSLHPVSTPAVNDVQYNGGGAISYTLVIEKGPDFKVREYKKIPVTKKARTISEEDVAKELEQLRERSAQLVPSQSQAAEARHYAVIRYDGFYQGKPVPGLQAENQILNLSAPQSIEGFAEGIVGMKLNESKEISVTFPKEHPNKELAGNPVQFKIILVELKEKSVPALDDEFAKDFELGSLEELKRNLRRSLERHLEDTQKADMEKQVFDHLVRENPIPVPEALVRAQAESQLERAKELLARQGLPAPDAEKEKELAEKYRPQAERQVRIGYLLSGVAKQESIQAAQEDLDREKQRALEANPGKSAEIERYFQDHRTAILSQIAEDKAVKFLIENAKMKEVAE